MLKDKIEADFKQALKQKKEEKVSILRMIKADILNKEKELRYKLSQGKPDLSQKNIEKQSAITEDKILDIINSRIKKGKESIALFEKGKRKDLVDKEKKEIEVLKKYLPEQLSAKEVEEIAKNAIKELGASSIKDMSKVMSKIMPELRGKADGSLVSGIIRELLS
jgi:uncharacterized protein YqeY